MLLNSSYLELLMSIKKSRELKGLKVVVDKLIYKRSEENITEGKPHAFIYFLTISNLSNQRIRLLGRKWVVQEEFGDVTVVEGDGIVGKTPTLKPGECFSYHSYHLTASNATSSGAFYGLDEYEDPIHTSIPAFELIVPEKF